MAAVVPCAPELGGGGGGEKEMTERAGSPERQRVLLVADGVPREGTKEYMDVVEVRERAGAGVAGSYFVATGHWYLGEAPSLVWYGLTGHSSLPPPSSVTWTS